MPPVLSTFPTVVCVGTVMVKRRTTLLASNREGRVNSQPLQVVDALAEVSFGSSDTLLP
jgi:hypothetical protein